jgi:hypothetical protein
MFSSKTLAQVDFIYKNAILWHANDKLRETSTSRTCKTGREIQFDGRNSKRQSNLTDKTFSVPVFFFLKPTVLILTVICFNDSGTRKCQNFKLLTRYNQLNLLDIAKF